MATDGTNPQASAAIAAEQTAPLTTEQQQTKLSDLKASATRQYSLKNYNAAAEFYSEAAELQDELNGEMSPENADLLYQYGRCLYHVAVSKSDVLGGKVASAEEPKRKKRKVAATQQGTESSSAAALRGEREGGASAGEGLIGDAMKEGEQKTAEEVLEAVVEEKEPTTTTTAKKENDDVASKPFFQITGDENWTDSEDEEDEDAADGEAEEEEDDFATAYEILDMARVLLARKLEASSSSSSDKDEQRQLKERLADTHDLQAEISLENERFHDAINDTREGLALKMLLYPEESSLIAEAHFKLSLALEFASVTSTSDATEEGSSGENAKVAQVDEELRREAALEMEKAIASCNARVAKEEAALSSLAPEKTAEQTRSIADVKDMVADMQQRLVDLRNPAVSLAGGVSGPAGAPDGSDPLRGVLGAMLGESKAEQQKRIQDATLNANDLSGLVKKKKVKVEDGAGAGAVDGKGKRKAEDGSGEAAAGGSGKKVKFEGDA